MGWLEALHALLFAIDSSNGVIAGSSTGAVGGTLRASSAMHTTTYATRNVSLLIVYPHFDVDGVCSYTFKSGRCPTAGSRVQKQ